MQSKRNDDRSLVADMPSQGQGDKRWGSKYRPDCGPYDSRPVLTVVSYVALSQDSGPDSSVVFLAGAPNWFKAVGMRGS